MDDFLHRRMETWINQFERVLQILVDPTRSWWVGGVWE